MLDDKVRKRSPPDLRGWSDIVKGNVAQMKQSYVSFKNRSIKRIRPNKNGVPGVNDDVEVYRGLFPPNDILFSGTYHFHGISSRPWVPSPNVSLYNPYRLDKVGEHAELSLTEFLDHLSLEALKGQKYPNNLLTIVPSFNCSLDLLGEEIMDDLSTIVSGGDLPEHVTLGNGYQGRSKYKGGYRGPAYLAMDVLLEYKGIDLKWARISVTEEHFEVCYMQLPVIEDKDGNRRPLFTPYWLSAKIHLFHGEDSVEEQTRVFLVWLNLYRFIRSKIRNVIGPDSTPVKAYSFNWKDQLPPSVKSYIEINQLLS